MRLPDFGKIFLSGRTNHFGEGSMDETTARNQVIDNLTAFLSGVFEDSDIIIEDGEKDEFARHVCDLAPGTTLFDFEGTSIGRGFDSDSFPDGVDVVECPIFSTDLGAGESAYVVRIPAPGAVLVFRFLCAEYCDDEADASISGWIYLNKDPEMLDLILKTVSSSVLRECFEQKLHDVASLIAQYPDVFADVIAKHLDKEDITSLIEVMTTAGWRVRQGNRSKPSGT